MAISRGVNILGLNRIIRRGLGILGKVVNENCEELIITSTFEGPDSERSLIYGIGGLDMRYPLKSKGVIVGRVMSVMDHGDTLQKEEVHVCIEYNLGRWPR
jgi:hypothetical protein